MQRMQLTQQPKSKKSVRCVSYVCCVTSVTFVALYTLRALHWMENTLYASTVRPPSHLSSSWMLRRVGNLLRFAARWRWWCTVRLDIVVGSTHWSGCLHFNVEDRGRGQRWWVDVRGLSVSVSAASAWPHLLLVVQPSRRLLRRQDDVAGRRTVDASCIHRRPPWRRRRTRTSSIPAATAAAATGSQWTRRPRSSAVAALHRSVSLSEMYVCNENESKLCRIFRLKKENCAEWNTN